MPDIYFRVVYSAPLDERQCLICSSLVLLRAHKILMLTGKRTGAISMSCHIDLTPACG
jgi:hypothetical protein